jgi:hypothetical protein
MGGGPYAPWNLAVLDGGALSGFLRGGSWRKRFDIALSSVRKKVDQHLV